jgi:hypothetical protein
VIRGADGAVIDVQVASTSNAVRAWLAAHRLSDTSNTTTTTAIGLDVEWRPTFVARSNAVNKVAVVQLATDTGVLLVQLRHVAPADAAAVRDALRSVLDSPRVLKVGVAVEGDLQRLQDDHGVAFRRYLDIGAAAKRVAATATMRDDPHHREEGDTHGEPGADCGCVDGACAAPLTPPDTTSSSNSSSSSEKYGLATLAQRYLAFTMEKTRSVRMSNWEAALLSPAQITYAALDAHISLRVFRALQAGGVAFCRKGRRRYLAHAFVAEAARSAAGDDGGGGGHGGGDGGETPSQVTVGGLGRGAFRRLYRVANESDWLLAAAGRHTLRVDRAWLASLPRLAVGAGGYAAPERVWREALAVYLGRLGWTLRLVTTLPLSPGAVHVAAVAADRVLARASGRNKGTAAEAACALALTELVTDVQPRVPSDRLVPCFIGADGLALLFKEYLSQKPPLPGDVS